MSEVESLGEVKDEPKQYIKWDGEVAELVWPCGGNCWVFILFYCMHLFKNISMYSSVFWRHAHYFQCVYVFWESWIHFLFLTFFRISLHLYLDGGFWGGVYLSLIVIFSITVDFTSVIESMNIMIVYVREYSVIFILLGLGSAINVDSFTDQATLNRDQGKKKVTEQVIERFVLPKRRYLKMMHDIVIRYASFLNTWMYWNYVCPI